MSQINQFLCRLGKHSKIKTRFSSFKKLIKVSQNNIPQADREMTFNITSWSCAYCPAIGEDQEVVDLIQPKQGE